MPAHGIRTRLAQANIHHAKAASAVLARKFAADNLGLALIQEPWTYKGQVRGLTSSDSKLIWDTREDSPRTCIKIRNNINYICLSEFMTRDLVPIQAQINIEGRIQTMVVAAAYFAGDEANIPPCEVQRLVDYCNRKKLPILIGCDANAHHTVWGSTNINQRGEYLLDFMMVKNLEIFNVGNSPTFITRTRKEVLDLTFGTPNVAYMVKDWRVSNEPSMSDHRIIVFTLEGLLTENTPGRNPKKTNWNLYQNVLKSNLEQLGPASTTKSNLELEVVVNEFSGAINEAYELSCPLKPKTRQKDAPWWNKHLSKLRSKVRKLFNEAKRTREWCNYSTLLTIYNKEIRKAKRNSFTNFCENISTTPAAARLHKALAKEKTLTSLALRYSDGTFTENEEQRCNLLLNTHFPGSLPLDGNLVEKTPLIPNREDWKIATTICTGKRIDWAINTFQPYKSPGADGIFPALLQKGKEFLMPYLINILRSSIALGYIPSLWRTAKVIFIPKIGKKDTTHPKSFRPISLTSFILKTLEKVIDNFIRSEVLISRPLNQRQHAYRAGRSTETALFELTNKIQRALDVKETALAAFLDIEGAFDNTSHEAVGKALVRKCVPNTITRWIIEMLGTRNAEAQAGQNVKKVITTRGCPQGGVLSPLLWSLVVDELLENLTSKGIYCIGFADDIAIIAVGKFEETLCDIIQRGLTITSKWSRSVGLSINPSKTTIIPFTRKRLLPHMKPIRLTGEVIETQREVKYLGIILDSKLLWNKHINYIVGKATKALMICKRIAGKSWGCKPSILRWMYTMMVRPIITYGAVAWHKKTELTTTRKILEKIQRLACICITGAMRTCPTAAIEVILHLSPLHEVIRSAGLGGIMRFSKEGTGTGKIIGLRERDLIDRSTITNLIDIPRDGMIKKHNFEKNFLIQLSNKEDWVGEDINYTLETNTIKWYTDGSRTSEGTGAGIFGPKTKLSIPMGQSTSIFQAEVNAIGKCVERNLERNYRNKNIAIMSDSQAALKALSSYTINSKLVGECICRLNELGKQNRVTLYWVPGHVGVPGNEKADSLAKLGASTPLTGPEPYCGIGENVIKTRIKLEEEANRTKNWYELPKLRQAKLLLGNYNRQRFENCINLSRNNLRIITGILTGHCRLRRHLNLLGVVSSATCRFCNMHEETPVHILGKCCPIMHQRKTHLGRYQVEESNLPSLKVPQMLKFLKAIGLEEEL